MFYPLENKQGLTLNIARGEIISLTDLKGSSISPELINELKGKVSLEKFVGRGGLEKSLSTWNNLNSNDQKIYNLIHGLKSRQTLPSNFLKQLASDFKIKTDNLYWSPDKAQLINSETGKAFDLSREGINKMIKFLLRQ